MLSDTILSIGLLALGSPVSSTADQALTVLQQNCGNDSCHGGPDAYRFDVGNPSTLVEAGVVKPGCSADSEVIPYGPKTEITRPRGDNSSAFR